MYAYGEPSGRKIGPIGDYILYQNTLTRKQSEIIVNTPKETNTTFNFTYGPSTGGIIESILFNISTTGELIMETSSDPLFKKRELKVIGRSIDDALPLIERINGVFTASHSIAFLAAVEDALELELDEYTLMGRIIELELERIRNHLHVIARTCEAAAFGVPYNSLFYIREKINRIIQKYSGHRFLYSANKVNSIKIDFRGISESLKDLENEIKDTYDTLRESKLFVDRLMNNGIIKEPEECLGPAARGCGYSYDARIDSDTLPYSELNFSPIIETEGNGDAMDRFIVRFEEILQSLEIIQDAEERLGKQEVKSFNYVEGEYEGVGRVESPSGDIAYLIKLKDDQINEINMLNSSKVNLPIFLKSTQDNVFTDFHFNWESFGIWVSEIAVEFK